MPFPSTSRYHSRRREIVRSKAEGVSGSGGGAEHEEDDGDKSVSKNQSLILLSSPSSFPTPTAPHVSNARRSASNSYSTSTGSHSTSSAESVTDEERKGKGKLSSLIYGTKEGREMEREIEHSFSQVLARGKYVHSIVFHEVKPDKVDEYVDLVGNWYPRMAGMPENKVHLVGSWRTEVGDCDTFGSQIAFPTGLLMIDNI